MAGVTQTIPNFNGGISEQPDDKKFPGQVNNVLNGIPDPIEGLVKRPGSQRIGTAVLANVQTTGRFFHYHRDETEGNYIGQVGTDGTVRMWSCTTGSELTVNYGTGGETAIKAYLATSDPVKNVRSLTLMDTTFLSNKDASNAKTEPDMVDQGWTLGWGDKTGDNSYDKTDEQYQCFIDLLRIENGRQYSLNVSDTETAGTAPRAFDWDTNKTLEQNEAPSSGNANSGSLISSATRIKIVEHSTNPLSEADGTGTCKGIGTQVFSSAETNHHNPAKNWQSAGSHKNVWGETVSHTAGAERIEYRHNLTFRITVNGQQGLKPDAGTSPGGSDYQCKYDRQVDLLCGGEGWQTGDTATVEMTTSKGAVDGANPEGYTTSAYHKIEVTEHEVVRHKANICAARPVPTPFDSDTAISADAVLGGIVSALNNVYHWGRNSPNNPTSGWNHTSGYPPNWNTASSGGYYDKTGNAMLKAPQSETLNIQTTDGTNIKYKIIGTGIYLYCSKPFNVETLDKDLMRVMHREVNNVADLPAQCRHGYVVRVLNFENSQDDDYYVRFNGENNRDGTGSWEECARPQIRNQIDASTMPVAIQRDSSGNSFTIKQWTWAEREVGDNVTNPKPSFLKTNQRAGTRINKCVFFRNRFGLLVGENVMLARPGTATEPNFWANTALTVSAIDPIDIASASLFPSDLEDAIELTAGLLCFSSNQQFLLTSDDTVLDPNTAKLKPVSSYNYNPKAAPISLGLTVGFIDNSNKYSRLMEMTGVGREAEPVVSNTTLLVPTLIPKEADLTTVSRENNILFVGQSYAGSNTSTSDLVYGFKYLLGEEGRKQGAWFKWRLSNPVKYMFIINDEFFYLDSDDFLQKINLLQSSDEVVVDDDQEGDFRIHLDNHVPITGGSYVADTDITTFTNVSWLSDVTQLWATHDLVIVDRDTASTRIGRYAKCTVNGTTITVRGDWSGSNYTIGYNFVYRVRLPKFYMKKMEGTQLDTDLSGYLTIHRLNFNFGKVGLYETVISRVGKEDYEDIHESTPADEYEVGDAPYLLDEIKTIPVYEKNTNVEVTLKSEHPSPATLRSLTWEGDYSPRNYRRV